MRRARTNTPLQALVLLNDPQYVEAARGLAERMLREGGADRRTRASPTLFRLVTGPRAATRASSPMLQRALTDLRGDVRATTPRRPASCSRSASRSRTRRSTRAELAALDDDRRASS